MITAETSPGPHPPGRITTGSGPTHPAPSRPAAPAPPPRPAKSYTSRPFSVTGGTYGYDRDPA